MESQSLVGFLDEETMQNHSGIMSKSQFWTRNMQKMVKRRDLNMSGPAKASPGGP